MGHLNRGGLNHDMLTLVLSVVLASCQAGGFIKEEIFNQVDSWNSDVACWGWENMVEWELALIKATEQCSKLSHPGSLLRPTPTNPWMTIPQPTNTRLASVGSSGVSRDQWNNLWQDFLGGRTKRQVTEGLLEYDKEEEIEKFLENHAAFKDDQRSKIGNLTCVLTKMEMLDAELQVNLQAYTNFWDDMDLSNTLAGEDPEWRQRMTEGYTDCYQLSQTWPQETLDRNPLTKVWGRHAIFFKCTKKVERHMCAAAQLYDWLNTMYGDSGSFNWTQNGFPSDKYDRAVVSVKVLQESHSDEEQYIKDFFYDIK